MKTINFNKNNSIFLQILGKVILILVLSGNDHSVKVSSNSEVGSGTALWEFFGFLREFVLNAMRQSAC